MRKESADPENAGSFIQLGSSGSFVPATVTEMERQVNPGRRDALRPEDLTVECRTIRGGMVRINGKLNAELLAALVRNL